MVNEVSKDNGKGGTAEANNRKYGGSIQNGTVATASFLLPSGVSTFHSHLEKELYMDNCEYTLQQRGSETVI